MLILVSNGYNRIVTGCTFLGKGADQVILGRREYLVYCKIFSFLTAKILECAYYVVVEIKTLKPNSLFH